MVPHAKLPGLENKNWKVTLCPPRKVPDGLWEVPFTGLLCAQKRSGKSNLIISLIKHYDRTKTFDHIYFFCKSVKLDPKYELLVDSNSFYKLTVFDDWSDAALQQIVDEQKERIDEFKRYQENLKVWKRYEALDDLGKLTPSELIALDAMCYCPPVCRYKQMPQAWVILDDMAYCPAFNLHNKTFSNWMVLHRHYLTSATVSLQMFKSNLSKSLRNNLSHICLWNQKSVQLQKEIAEEFSNLVMPEQFIAMWKYATREQPHDFFCVDMYARDRALMFRKNLNELLDPADFSDFSASVSDEDVALPPSPKQAEKDTREKEEDAKSLGAGTR